MISAEAARQIGDCTIRSISTVTGKSWEDVWDSGNPFFKQHGMNCGGIEATLRVLGWRSDAYYGMDWMRNRITVRQAECWLQQHDPHVRLISTIMVKGVLHSIAFNDGCFHNVLGAYRAFLRSVYRITPCNL